jgi:hypothetical protein
VRQQLECGMRLLARLSPAFENQTLKKFIDKFSERYEGQEVPLTLVLNPEMGLDYPAGDRSQLDRTPLVHDLL